jgi:hypothetical protein
MDGIAVTLLVLVAGFALVVQPAAEQTSQGRLATIVDFSYPVLDVIPIGAVLGVYGLLGWRPDAMWILIGLGIVTTSIADAAFAVQEARGVAEDGHYDFVWTVGAPTRARCPQKRRPVSLPQVSPPELPPVQLRTFNPALTMKPCPLPVGATKAIPPTPQKCRPRS